MKKKKNMPENNSPHEMKKSRFLLIRLFWISLGSIFVGIGTIGIFVPGLPTTVFLILASACYIRSSERLYNWLIKNKTFGKYIKDFREGKGMPQRAKITALSMMTIFVLLAVLPFSPIAIPNNTMRIIILAVGMIGFYYVSFRVPTKKD
ncbi:MAG: YbaN family protein [Chloroflexota bacterium]|nr:YbaN family protein [Chloroflexota bacterium]